MPTPAMEAVTMTRDGSSRVAFLCRSGANLRAGVNSTASQRRHGGLENILDHIQSNCVEHALDVQVHDLGESGVRMRVEFLTPRCTSVREEYVDMVCRLLDFLDQCLDTSYLGAVGWD